MELPPQQAFMLTKLKNDPRYKHLTEEKLIEKADQLTDPGYIRGMFSYLLEAANRLAWEVAADAEDGGELLHTLELEAAHVKVKHQLAQASHLPVRLLLSKLRRRPPQFLQRFSVVLGLEYGALHSALQVGEVVIEWGRESIVDPRFERIVPDREFQVHVHDQGDWHDRGHLFMKQMSMADRKRDLDEKFDVLYNSTAEKYQLIENLIEVIVDYNCKKQYSVFRCNCQHFVHDALVALGIKKTPQFKGWLSQYLDQLKVGRSKVPEDFQNHERLDEYVFLNIDQMTPHDMEYLLCQYFKHHLPEMEKDLDNWVCTIETCQAGALEERIKEHALLFNQFKTQSQNPQAINKPVCVATPIVEEEEDSNSDQEELELVNEEFGNMSLERQRSLLNKFSGYRENVKVKLTKHPAYDSNNEDRQIDFLTEREKFREEFFSALVEGTTTRLVMETSFDRVVSPGIPPREAQQRETERFRILYNFPVKLVARIAPGVKSVEQAPFELSLIAGGFSLQWDKYELVFPKNVSSDLRSHPTLQVGLLCNSEWSRFVNQQKPLIDRAIKQLNFEALIDFKFELAKKRDALLNALIDVIVDYNRHYEYHRKKRNNDHFIKDACEALGISRPLPINTTMKKHAKTVQLAKKNFVSHLDLDMELLERDRDECLANIPQVEQDFYISQYFAFHVQDWVQRECPDNWECGTQTCQLADLEKHSVMSF